MLFDLDLVALWLPFMFSLGWGWVGNPVEILYASGGKTVFQASTSILCRLKSSRIATFKVIPQYCTAHPVLRIITRNKI